MRTASSVVECTTREVVEVVVVETELAECRDQHDLPDAAHRIFERSVHLRRQQDRSRDQHCLEAEDSEAASRNVTVEHLHGRSALIPA